MQKIISIISIFLFLFIVDCRFPGLDDFLWKKSTFLGFQSLFQNKVFSIGGTVTGLEGSRFRLQLSSTNGQVLEEVSRNQNGEFQFQRRLSSGQRYSVQISNQPIQPYQECIVLGAEGIVRDTDVLNIQIDCQDTDILPPRFSPSPGIFGTPQNISLLPRSEDTNSIFTLDGSDPDCNLAGNTQAYTSPIQLPYDSITEIRTRACWNGEESAVDFGTFEVLQGTLQNLVITPATFTSINPVEIEIIYPGSESVDIFYTFDYNNQPNCSGMGIGYTGSILVTDSRNIFAIACRASYLPSNIAIGSYTINEQVAPPLPDFPEDTYNNDVMVQMESSTPGSIIRYTLDGSIPSCSSGMEGNIANITSNNENVLRAIACRDGYNPSIIMGPYTYNLLVSPVQIQPPSGVFQNNVTVTMSSGTLGSEIRYAMNLSDPLDCETGIIYTNPFELVTGGIDYEIKAIACKLGYADSIPFERNYTVNGKLSNPNFFDDYPNTNFVSLSIGSSPPISANQLICYTTNGSDPFCSLINGGSVSSAIGGFCGQNIQTYDGNPLDILSSTNLRIRICSNGWTQSDIMPVTIDRPNSVAIPVFSSPSGEYNNTFSIGITSLNAISIYYTLNGNEPDCSGTEGILYDGSPILIEASSEIKAIGCNSNSGWVNSDVGTALYFLKVGDLIFNPSISGVITNSPFNLEISTITSDASIFYTTDGNLPVCGSSTLYTGSINMASGTNITLQAVGCRPGGFVQSNLRTASYEITGTLPQPTINSSLNLVPLLTSSVTITAPAFPTGRIICYRTGGTNPSCANTPGGAPSDTGGSCASGSNMYSASFNVTTGTTIRARTCLNNWIASPITVE